MTFTYLTLQQAAIAASEDDSAEFATYLPTGVELAELRLTRDLDTFGLVSLAYSSVSAGDPFITKPDGCVVIKSLGYQISTGERINLLLRTDEFIMDYWPIRTSTGTPKYYANWGFSNVIFAPTPSDNFYVEMSYVVRPEALSSTQTTNWFTDFASEALFYALMVEMCLFMKKPEAVALWENRYSQALSSLSVETNRTRRDDMQSMNSQAQENTIGDP